MASLVFNSAIRAALTGGVNFAADTFKMILLSAVPGETEKDGWDFRSDVTTEITGTGYTAGGSTVALTVAATDDTNNDVEITAGSVAWPSSTITAVAALIYKSTGVASSDQLIGTIDFGGTVSSTSDTFTVTPSGSIKFQN